MLFARVLLCPMPRAGVTLDLEAAKKIPGVAAVWSIGPAETAFLGQPIAVAAAATTRGGRGRAPRDRGEARAKPVGRRCVAGARGRSSRARSGGNVSEGIDRRRREGGAAALAGAAPSSRRPTRLPSSTTPASRRTASSSTSAAARRRRVRPPRRAPFTVPRRGRGGARTPRGPRDRDRRAHGRRASAASSACGRSAQVACRSRRSSKRPVHLMLDRDAEFLAAGEPQRLAAGPARRRVEGRSPRRFVGDVTKLGGQGGRVVPRRSAVPLRLREGVHPRPQRLHAHGLVVRDARAGPPAGLVRDGNRSSTSSPTRSGSIRSRSGRST
jgi:hypothetical protein